MKSIFTSSDSGLLDGNVACMTATNSQNNQRDKSQNPEYVEIAGEQFLCIRNVDQMPPFLMSIVSNSDAWLFAGSNGGFTAGRCNPDQAIFPYQNADRILAQPRAAGAVTVILVDGESWTPWTNEPAGVGVIRNLYKHVCGTRVIYEEVNHFLGLRLRWSLECGERFGLIRSCTLENLKRERRKISMLDGWHHLMPSGVTRDTYSRYSYLAAAYMRHEVVPEVGLGIYTLNSGISDRAEPCEALHVTCAWTLGHQDPVLMLSDRQLDAFRRGLSVIEDREIRGEFGAHLIASEFELAPNAGHSWYLVADGGMDHAAVVELKKLLTTPEKLCDLLETDMRENLDGLKRRIAGADSAQQTADHVMNVHHFANVLFNCMRGGTLEDGYYFSREDFMNFLGSRNRSLLAEIKDELSRLPERSSLQKLSEFAAVSDNPTLIRLAREYLPLSFSRRHGDPSRPWNHFDIHTRDRRGRKLYGYSGNWRDIFQNWEALAYSYPLCFESMIAVFLNASTADGYNPYRITREGIDWEVLDPKDPWSYIGYWGDHQIIYLLRLLEGLQRFQPERLRDALNDRHFTYANVPYEIRGFDQLLEDPRNSIDFNEELHLQLMQRAAELGGDGKLLADEEGNILQVTLAEKLLVPLLTKLSNLVPGGGIWLNTQRPEWNDANNALAGWGLSVVTVAYLRRYLKFFGDLIDSSSTESVELSVPVVELMESLQLVLAAAGVPLDDKARFDCLSALGRAGEAYRKKVYQRKPFARRQVNVKCVREFISVALKAIDATLDANRRDDGLFHSYNLLALGENTVSIRFLQTMLEGQVAALSSGLLAPDEASRLLASLRESDLYREDQKTYLLYPDKQIISFLERNILPAGWQSKAPVLAELVKTGNNDIISVDGAGDAHFCADLSNERDLSAALDQLASNPDWNVPVERDHEAVLELWEEVFHHHAFTGRSGAMFAFEGLGSIYWHMVAKLLLAVQELHDQDREGETALKSQYDAIREGLGFTKDALTYGAFPSDPYSYSPRHMGAQQPGMTGQVKEEILTRMGELGVRIENGSLRFRPTLLEKKEFFTNSHRFDYLDVNGKPQHWCLESGSLAFTVFQVPICYQIGDKTAIFVEWGNGKVTSYQDTRLPGKESQELFHRSGAIHSITVTLPDEWLR